MALRSMPSIAFTRLSVLLIASQAVGCRPSPTPSALSDTAFIEERRMELRGVRMPSGGCAFRGPPMVLTAADTVRVFREQHSISVNQSTCVQLVAIGYRKRLPARLTTGMTGMAGVGETSAAVVYDSTKPVPLPPP